MGYNLKIILKYSDGRGQVGKGGTSGEERERGQRFLSCTVGLQFKIVQSELIELKKLSFHNQKMGN